MADPPRDGDGLVEPHDDFEAIPNDSFVIRYIQRLQLIANEEGDYRLSSGAFSPTNASRDPYRGMSVEMLSRLIADGVDPKTRLPNNHVGAVLLKAGDLRDLGCQVGPDPMPTNHRYHASVWGMSRSHPKKLRDMCEWLIRPDYL